MRQNCVIYCLHFSVFIFIVFFVFRVETRSVKGLIQKDVELGKLKENGKKPPIVQPQPDSQKKITSGQEFQDYLTSLLKREELLKNKGVKVQTHSRQKRGKIKKIVIIFIKILVKVFIKVAKVAFLAAG